MIVSPFPHRARYGPQRALPPSRRCNLFAAPRTPADSHLPDRILRVPTHHDSARSAIILSDLLPNGNPRAVCDAHIVSSFAPICSRLNGALSSPINAPGQPDTTPASGAAAILPPVCRGVRAAVPARLAPPRWSFRPRCASALSSSRGLQIESFRSVASTTAYGRRKVLIYICDI